MEQKRMNVAFRQYLLISLLNCSYSVYVIADLGSFMQARGVQESAPDSPKCAFDLGATDHKVAQSDRAQLTCAVHD